MRGGAPLKTIIEEECPVEMRDHIFTNAKMPVITFHRIKDFQLVTMKLLAQETLAECPNFKGKHVSTSSADLLAGPNVDLKLPGEVRRALAPALALALAPSLALALALTRLRPLGHAATRQSVRCGQGPAAGEG